jgi:hypothetical protein
MQIISGILYAWHLPISGNDGVSELLDFSEKILTSPPFSHESIAWRVVGSAHDALTNVRQIDWV